MPQIPVREQLREKQGLGDTDEGSMKRRYWPTLEIIMKVADMRPMLRD